MDESVRIVDGDGKTSHIAVMPKIAFIGDRFTFVGGVLAFHSVLNYSVPQLVARADPGLRIEIFAA